ncbi:MAG: protein-disulfide reductase DsbD [Pseudomonadota bacterium]
MKLSKFLTAAALLLTLPALAIDESDLLPVEEAFALTIDAAAGDELTAAWTVADGYYLYRGRTSFESNTPGVTLGAFELPPGKPYTDEFFGDVQTWRGALSFPIPLVRTDPAVSTVELVVKSQGCADLGVCYPPNRRFVQVALPAAAPALDLGGASGGGLELGAAPAGDLSFGQSSGGGLFDAADALPVDDAFRFETIAMAGDELLARWTIAEGYYLYRDKIEFITGADQPAAIAGFDLPAGVPMTDEHFGDVEVYFDQVEVPIRLNRTNADAGALMLTALYQGCKEAGICYPPVEKLLPVMLPSYSGPLAEATVAPTATAGDAEQPKPEQDRLADALEKNAAITLLTFFGLGLLLAFTPCVFPMVPILSGIIAGQGEGITTRRAFVLSLVYVLAMAITYTVAGVIAGYFGYNLQAAFQNAWVLGFFSLIFVLLALSMFGFYELQLPASLQSKLNDISNQQSGGTLMGVGIMGFLSALIVGPCVAPPLAAALIYIGQTGDPVLGGAALFSLSMGMGAPLIAIGTSAGKFLPSAGAWMDAVKAVFGVALLGLAIWMLERIAPPQLILVLWGILAIASGVYLGALERLPEGASGWRKLWKSLGVILLLVGAIELVGAAAGGNDWTRPLKGVFGGGGAATQAAGPQFVKIKSLDDLRAQVGNGQPVMLDFYADWCVDCKRMDRYTFPEPPVVAALQNGIAVKADVTANDDIDQALMREFRIIGPPAILFFDAAGNEMPQYRVVGFQKAEPFAQHVADAFAAGAR